MAEEDFVIDAEDRYSRMRLISWWRQEDIQRAKIMVVGAGAIGNEVLKNAALLGIGHIFIIDLDTVEITNLTRTVLFRRSDIGRYKADVAAEAVKEINPDVKVIAFNGDVVTDLGLGVFSEMDVIIGCLDNREARLWINRQSYKVSKPYVDGAIQEISGVVKIFTPPDSSCYECGMTKRDHELLTVKKSCTRLRESDVTKGKTPTTPTIASIVAGIEVQEAMKIIHGLPVQGGTAIVFSGETNNVYSTRIQVKPDCLSHETYGEPTDVPLGNQNTSRELMEAAGGVRVLLVHDLLVYLDCPACGARVDVLEPIIRVDMKRGICPNCGTVMNPVTVNSVSLEDPLADLPMAQVGIPIYDIVKVETPDSGVYARLSNDRNIALDWV